MAIFDLLSSMRPSDLVVVIVGTFLFYNICKASRKSGYWSTYANKQKYSYRLWFHPLASYPGPLLARASSIWSTSAARKLRKAQSIQAAHERYGPVVRVAPNELSFSNPAVLKDVYGHGLGLPKTDFYKAGKFTSVDSVFSMRDRHQHSARRSIMAKTFSYASILTYVPMMSEKLTKTFNKFVQESHGGTVPVEVYHWVHLFALDVVFHFTLNHESGSLETGKPHAVMHDLESFQASFAWSALFPPLRGFGRFLPIKSISYPFQTLHNWIEFAVQNVQRERNNDKRAEVMARLIETQDSWLGRKLNDEEIAEEVLAFMFAGSGTTANTIVFLIWSVLRDREIHRKLINELRAALQNPKEIPEITAVNKLPYTNAVIMEALRRYPTIPGMQPRLVVDNNTRIDGRVVPRGTIIGVQNYSLHRDPVFFPNPEAFIPERWLAADSTAQRAAFNGFGTGPRACIGRNIAMIELQLVVSSFFRRFNARLAESVTDADMVMTDGFSGGPAGQKLELCLEESKD